VIGPSSLGALRGDALSGRTAVITAASSGIGLASAAALALAGAQTFLVARGENRLREAQEHVPGSTIVTADLSTTDGVDSLIKFMETIDRKVDILVNCAGGGNFVAADSIDREAIAAVFDLNVKATILLSSAFGAGMVQRGFGSIVNISSMAADLGCSHLTLYSAAKSAVNGFTRALAAEWGRSGVRVNAVMAGLIETARNVGMFEDEEIMEEFNSRCDLGRPAQPSEVGRVVAFLACDDSSYITGQCIPVDGGAIGSHHGHTRHAAGLS
jgi:NAD(P)-dependent dehydrogenase (short-subunit alcohol dehydrogenase family)